MNYKIETVRALSVWHRGAGCKCVLPGFLMQNLSDTATVYFREKDADGKDCTAQNGFALPPGAVQERVYTAHTLSLVASAAGADVRILLVDIG